MKISVLFLCALVQSLMAKGAVVRKTPAREPLVRKVEPRKAPSKPTTQKPASKAKPVTASKRPFARPTKKPNANKNPVATKPVVKKTVSAKKPVAIKKAVATKKPVAQRKVPAKPASKPADKPTEQPSTQPEMGAARTESQLEAAMAYMKAQGPVEESGGKPIDELVAADSEERHVEPYNRDEFMRAREEHLKGNKKAYEKETKGSCCENEASRIYGANTAIALCFIALMFI